MIVKLSRNQMPKSNNFGSIGNTYDHGKGASKIASENMRKQRDLVIDDFEMKENKFIFRIRGRKMMTVTAKGDIKKKIVSKLCVPVPVPENPNL